jgi:hypothetical protein
VVASIIVSLAKMESELYLATDLQKSKNWLNRLQDQILFLFQGDYLMYNKEKDFYYNLSYAQIKNLYWNSELIVGYVANDEINNNNGNKDKTSMIDLSRSD